MAENLHQQQVIEQLVARIDVVEELLQVWQEDQRKQRQRAGWGGFFSLQGSQAGG
jgi:hypothetical protein